MKFWTITDVQSIRVDGLNNLFLNVEVQSIAPLDKKNYIGSNASFISEI